MMCGEKEISLPVATRMHDALTKTSNRQFYFPNFPLPSSLSLSISLFFYLSLSLLSPLRDALCIVTTNLALDPSF